MRPFAYSYWPAVALIALASPGACGGLSHPQKPAAFQDCADCPAMMPIPAGTFLMGSSLSEPGRDVAEGPQHRVAMKRFAMGVHDVTLAEFTRFAAATSYEDRGQGCDWRSPQAHGTSLSQSPNDPVVCVSWDGARAYAEWLSRKTGKLYRLPSEAEWEYAARAGSTTARPWGAGISRDNANYGADTCCSPSASGRDRWLYTSPVGSFPQNRFGIYEMLGDVWQRTADCAHEDYSGAPRDGSAWDGTGDCKLRMVRGGGWFHPPGLLRSAARAADPAARRMSDIGFRLARSL